MKLAELFRKMGESRLSLVESDGSLTTDKTLLSLRRQKRLMDEAEEKQAIKAELRRRAMARDRAVFSDNAYKKRVGERTILSRLPVEKGKRFLSKSTMVRR